LPISYNRIWE